MHRCLHRNEVFEKSQSFSLFMTCKISCERKRQNWIYHVREELSHKLLDNMQKYFSQIVYLHCSQTHMRCGKFYFFNVCGLIVMQLGMLSQMHDSREKLRSHTRTIKRFVWVVKFLDFHVKEDSTCECIRLWLVFMSHKKFLL
jgi:hypothetical protein